MRERRGVTPLEGLRVLDLSRVVSGPYATRMMSDLGADVLKVEPPDGDVSDLFGERRAGRSGLFAQMNAGKRVVQFDVRQSSDLAAVRGLAGVADVLVDNFRPGVLDRMGLSYDAIAATNPGLVQLSISGFGRNGPEAGRRAYAPVIHAESGLLFRQSRFSGCTPGDLGLAMSDTLAALHGTVAVLAALRERDQTGHGCFIDLSMLDATVASDDHAHWSIDGVESPSTSLGVVWTTAYGAVLVAASPQGTWSILAGLGWVVDDPEPHESVAEKIIRRRSTLSSWFMSFAARAELIDALEAAGLGWAEVRPPEDLLVQPTLAADPPFQVVPDGEGGTRRIVAMPYRFNGERSAIRGRVPGVAEHDEAAISEWMGRRGPRSGGDHDGRS